jgi:hypothetical protein
MTKMLIAVINKSTLVTDTDVDLMCRAIQTQMNLHLIPAWNLQAITVKFYSSLDKVPSYGWLVTMLDESTVAGALGYHSEDNDKIDGFIFCKPVLDNAGVVLYDPANPQNVSISSVLSHEVCEMVGDRFANFWADGPAIKQGSEYALELADPVEGDSYEIDVVDTTTKAVTKVSVSNFIFPAWFNTQSTKLNLPFDYLKKLTKAFSMTKGGYLIVRKSGTVSQVFGEEMPEWKKALKTGDLSRGGQRGQ